MTKNNYLKLNFYGNPKFILVFLFLFYGMSSAFGQGEDESRNDCADGEIEIKGDFLFKVNGDLYKDGKKLNLCPNSGDTKIILVHEVSPNNPVSENEYEIIWKNNPNLTEDWEVTLLENDIKKNLTKELKVSINGSSDYKLKIGNKVKVEFENKSSSPYDNGKYTYIGVDGVGYNGQYPLYGKNPISKKPYYWKFVAEGSIESLKMKANKKKPFDLKSINLESDNPEVTLSPSENIISKETDIDISHTGEILEGVPIGINGCALHDEVKVWVGPRSDIELTFFLLGELQSSGSVNYPAVVPKADLENIVNELNMFYNTYNVYFTSDYSLTNIHLDYDSSDGAVPILPNDVIIKDLKNIEEVVNFHNPKDGKLPVFYCHDLSGNALGQGMHPENYVGPVLYLLVIDRKDGMDSNTHAHEIGHTCFNLQHTNDPPFNQTDIKNLMYFDTTNGSNLSDYILRRSQYLRIHQNHQNQK